MSAVIKANPQLPAHIAKLNLQVGGAAINEMTGGITSGFPIISYKGKVWRMRKGGEEIMHLDDQNNAMPSIDVVLVQANPMPSKIFYDKKYEEGTTEAPRCFSNDGMVPDVSVQAPICKSCAACPNNVWGSRITDNGKKSRACSDARRMAIVFANDLNEKGEECAKYLLRVPPASLNPLKDYAEKMLAPRGIQFFNVVTRIGFDPAAAHPQFQFKPVRLLNEGEATAVGGLRGSEDVRRILAEAQEFPVGETGATEPSDASAGTPAPASPTTSPAGKPAKAKAAMRPATEEEAGAATIVQPTPAPVVATQDAFFAEPAAAPAKPKPAKPAKAAVVAPTPAPVVAVVEEEEETPAPAAAATKGAEFESLLDTILNG